MYEHLLEKISSILSVDYVTPPDLNPHQEDTGVLYKALEKVVEFSVESHLPRLGGASTVDEIVRIYVEQYDKNKEKILSLAK